MSLFRAGSETPPTESQKRILTENEQFIAINHEMSLLVKLEHLDELIIKKKIIYERLHRQYVKAVDEQDKLSALINGQTFKPKKYIRKLDFSDFPGLGIEQKRSKEVDFETMMKKPFTRAQFNEANRSTGQLQKMVKRRKEYLQMLEGEIDLLRRMIQNTRNMTQAMRNTYFHDFDIELSDNLDDYATPPDGDLKWDKDMDELLDLPYDEIMDGTMDLDENDLNNIFD